MTAQAVQTAQKPSKAISAFEELRGQLVTRAEDFKMVLPSHISPEKFQRTVLTAVQQNPSLLQADRGSFLRECMKAAQDGLLPDGREAALVIFNTRKKDANGKWQTVAMVQYMPMVYGLRKKILQSGEIADIQTAIVYRQEIENKLFLYEEGTERMLRHKPLLDPDFNPTDNDIAAAYSVATFKDGSKSFEVMRRSEIDKIRQMSKTGAVGRRDKDGNEIKPSGPWVDWYSEMARKTVMRRHAKTLPMSGDIIDVEAMEEALAARSALSVLASDEPSPPPPPSRADIKAIDHDPYTGEISDEEKRLDDEFAATVSGRIPLDDPEPEPEELPDLPPLAEAPSAAEWAALMEKHLAAADTEAAVSALRHAINADLLAIGKQDRAEFQRLCGLFTAKINQLSEGN